MLGVGSRGACMAAEDLWRNSCVRRWLWRSAYNKGSALVIRLVTKSLNSPRRPRNTYKLKSSSETGRPATTNSSNKAFAFCINWVTNSSPCRRSWREPWSCIIRELEVEARTRSGVPQAEQELRQPTTRCKTSIDREERRALKMSWSCCFQVWKSRFTWREIPSWARTCVDGHVLEPSTKPKTP